MAQARQPPGTISETMVSSFAGHLPIAHRSRLGLQQCIQEDRLQRGEHLGPCSAAQGCRDPTVDLGGDPRADVVDHVVVGAHQGMGASACQARLIGHQQREGGELLGDPVGGAGRGIDVERQLNSPGPGTARRTGPRWMGNAHRTRRARVLPARPEPAPRHRSAHRGVVSRHRTRDGRHASALTLCVV